MDQDEAPPYSPTAGDLHPVLAQVPAPEEHQDWAAGAISKIQDHLTATAIADKNVATGDKFVTDLDGIKQNLLGMVRSDPHHANLALGLVQDMPLPDELATHFSSEIAHTAVQGYAAISRDAGHAAIDRLSGFLADGDVPALRQYTDNLDTLRQADARAALLQHAKGMVAASNSAALAHLSDLQDPATGDIKYSPGWGQRMMQDMSLAPEAKASLYRAYSNVQQNGDLETSNPRLVASLVSRLAQGHQNPDHPTPPEILGHTGSGLTVADAKWLGTLSGPQPVNVRDRVQAISGAISDARQEIGNPQAFGRFMSWFVPRAQQGAVLDPASKDYLMTPERMAQFQPTGDDVIAPAVRSGPRPSLGEIFGR